MYENDLYDDDADSFADFDDDYDADFDDESDEGICPKCQASIYEDSVRCPICGEYVNVTSGSALSGRPKWQIILFLLGVFATIIALALY